MDETLERVGSRIDGCIIEALICNTAAILAFSSSDQMHVHAKLRLRICCKIIMTFILYMPQRRSHSPELGVFMLHMRSTPSIIKRPCRDALGSLWHCPIDFFVLTFPTHYASFRFVSMSFCRSRYVITSLFALGIVVLDFVELGWPDGL